MMLVGHKFNMRLQTAIDASGLTKAQLAKAINTDAPHIYHMCAGKKAPSLQTLSKLLTAMPGIDARWLICDTSVKADRGVAA